MPHTVPEEIDPEILEEFLRESTDLCDRFESVALLWDSAPCTRPQIDELFRLVHTLKGSSTPSQRF